MVDLQVLFLALGAWIFGVLVGAVGIVRHALLSPSPPARQVPPAATPPGDRDEENRPTLPDPWPGPWHPPRAPAPFHGRVRGRGICLRCGERWGTCDHTRNG